MPLKTLLKPPALFGTLAAAAEVEKPWRQESRKRGLELARQALEMAGMTDGLRNTESYYGGFPRSATCEADGWSMVRRKVLDRVVTAIV